MTDEGTIDDRLKKSLEGLEVLREVVSDPDVIEKSRNACRIHRRDYHWWNELSVSYALGTGTQRMKYGPGIMKHIRFDGEELSYEIHVWGSMSKDHRILPLNEEYVERVVRTFPGQVSAETFRTSSWDEKYSTQVIPVTLMEVLGLGVDNVRGKLLARADEIIKKDLV